MEKKKEPTKRQLAEQKKRYDELMNVIDDAAAWSKDFRGPLAEFLKDKEDTGMFINKCVMMFVMLAYKTAFVGTSDADKAREILIGLSRIMPDVFDNDALLESVKKVYREQ